MDFGFGIWDFGFRSANLQLNAAVGAVLSILTGQTQTMLNEQTQNPKSQIPNPKSIPAPALLPTPLFSAGHFFFGIGSLYAKFFQPVLEGSERKPQEFRGLGDVVVRLLHGLRNQIALNILKVDSFGRQFEGTLRCRPHFLPNLRRQVVEGNLISFAKQDRSFNC